MLAAKNPIATSLAFNHLIENVRANLFGLSPDRKKNHELDDPQRVKGVLGMNTGSRDVKECNKRASLHVHGQTHGGVRGTARRCRVVCACPRHRALTLACVGVQATPALKSDIAHEPRLRDAVMRALDSQLRGEIPLVYHVAYLAQKALFVPARRDAAWEAPRVERTPPPKPRANAGAAARLEWEQRQAEYEAYIVDEWWPEFEHHALTVVMNRHTHEHCATCLKGKRGKTGCRLCAPWAHDINCTRCVELRLQRSQDEELGLEFRCRACHADGALSDLKLTEAQRAAAVVKADAQRDICYTAHVPSAAGAARRDDRILAVELRRRLVPTDGDEAPPTSQLAAEQPPAQVEGAQQPPTSEPYVDLLAAFVKRARAAALAGSPLSFTKEEMSDAEVRSTIRSFSSTGQKFCSLLARADFRALRDRLDEDCADPSADAELAQVEKRMRRLRNLLEQLAASEMTCRNGRMADFSIYIAGCTNGNAVPYDLGAGEGSKGAAMYEIKYMGKDCVDLGAAASVLVDAAKHVREYPSVAEDSGEDGRTARHFAQHVINHSHMELEAVQAAGVVLGLRSSGSSGSVLQYHSAWDLVKQAQVAGTGSISFARGEAGEGGDDADAQTEIDEEEGQVELDFDEGGPACRRPPPLQHAPPHAPLHSPPIEHTA